MYIQVHLLFCSSFRIERKKIQLHFLSTVSPLVPSSHWYSQWRDCLISKHNEQNRRRRVFEFAKMSSGIVIPDFEVEDNEWPECDLHIFCEILCHSFGVILDGSSFASFHADTPSSPPYRETRRPQVRSCLLSCVIKVRRGLSGDGCQPSWTISMDLSK